MADLIPCPRCGLRQTVQHAYCSRCKHALTRSSDKYSTAATPVSAQVKDGMNEGAPAGTEPDVERKTSDPGAREFHVRGRPQAELYASEHSIPPEDSLLADLVAGRVTRNARDSDEDPDEFSFEVDRADKARSQPRPLTNPGMPRAPTNPGGRAGRHQEDPEGPRRLQRSQQDPRSPISGRTIVGLAAVVIAAIFLVFALASSLAVYRVKTGTTRITAGDGDDSAKSAEGPAPASP